MPVLPSKGMRIAVVSPFLDRQHGTERCTVEQVERLASQHGCEIHLYCQHVKDLTGVEPWTRTAKLPAPGHIFWHRVPTIPGPHLIRFLWWMAANRWWRQRDSESGQAPYDLVYSPGVNCSDADVVMVHVVFHELAPMLRETAFLGRFSLLAWFRRTHRRLYYRLLIGLEEQIYSKPGLALATVSNRGARDIARHFGRTDVAIIPCGVDVAVFNPGTRLLRRQGARKHFGYADHQFVVLLIGNDWKNKGLPVLLEAASACAELPLRLLVVGQDDRSPFLEMVKTFGLAQSVRFEDTSPDVMQFYAAADAYASPSVHDSFAVPVIEAMACGLPAVTSSEAGVSAFIEDGADAFILRDPRDAAALARILRRLYEDRDLRQEVGERAAQTAHRFSWDKNAAATLEVLHEAMRKKNILNAPAH